MNRSVEILQDARERLFDRGWQKCGYGPYIGPNCIAGAINNSRSYAVETIVVYKTLEVVAKERGFPGIVYLNDHQDTTFDDILDVIELAIKKLEQDDC